MFLCPKCHDLSGCGWPVFIELPSNGKCEYCGENARCTDCHGYDFRGARGDQQ